MTLIQASPIEVRELNLNDFRLTLKDLEDEIQGINWPKTHNHEPPFQIGGVELARTVKLVNEYTVTFEDGQYAVNLVGANSNVGDRVNVNQVSVRSANSAGLVHSSDIEFASFHNTVTVDVANITGRAQAGTIFPAGTLRQPVDNLADAMVIAAYRGINTISVIGDLTIDGGADYTQMNFVGESIGKTTLTVNSDAIVPECEFYEATITGTLDGNAKLMRCRVLDLTYVYGVVEKCMLGPGTIVLGGSNEAHFLDCWSGVAGLGTPVIDCGGSGQDLALRNYNGGIKIINKTGTDKTSIDINSGQIILDSTVDISADDQVRIGGNGMLTDNSTGAGSPNTYGLMSKQTITEITWDIIYIDVANGTAGTNWPIGTRGTPSNNITDARTIGIANDICCYKVVGNITLDADFSTSVFDANSPELATINLNNQNVAGAAFNHISLEGTCNGSIHAHNCELDSISNIEGVFIDCALSDGFSVKSGGKAYFFRCFSHDLAPMSFDMNGDGILVYYGTAWITVTNLTSATGLCAFSGDIGVTIDSSMSDGYVYITGDTVIDADSKTGGTVSTAYKNSAKMWEEIRANHTIAGTFGAVDEWAGAINETAIRQAVWNANKDDYNDPDTMGELQNTGGTGGGLTAEETAAAVWNAISSNYGTPGTTGWLLNLIDDGIIKQPTVLPGD
jgi:hypothetical protein